MAVSNEISTELKEAVIKACNLLSMYQRLLESKGQASEATKVKNAKDGLWDACRKVCN